MIRGDSGRRSSQRGARAQFLRRHRGFRLAWTRYVPCGLKTDAATSTPRPSLIPRRYSLPRAMSASYSTRLILAYRSGDVCALPGCQRNLSVDSDGGKPTNVGEAAHIAGEKATSARYDDSMTDQQRDHCDNLIYLCRTCHAIVDAIPQGEVDYPVARLRRIKQDHERTVREAVHSALPNVGFPELEETIQGFLQLNPESADGSFFLVPLDDKLKKNSLGNSSKVTLAMGLTLSREVRNFVMAITQTEPGFPDRLKAGFLEEYYRLKRAGHSADDLFDLMCRFAQRGCREQVKKSAGIAVLVYLFEACEVFER